ncbi:MAG: hypothetical protein ABIL61_05765 [candidate division WOR-3 bacterium]
MIRKIMIVLALYVKVGYAQGSKIIWLNYHSVGCVTCHRIASVKVSDTLFLIGSFHYQDNKLKPFIIAVDERLNIKWLKAFDHNLVNAGIVSMKKINDSLIALSGGHTYAQGQCPNNNCSFFGLFNVKTQNFVWAKYRQTEQQAWHISITAIDFDGSNIILGAQSMVNNKGSWILKVDLDGNLLWQKLISYNNNEFSVMDVVYDGQNYVFLIRNNNGENPTLVKISQDGSLLWAKSYDFGGYDYPYKILKDLDGYIIIGFKCVNSSNCSNLNDDKILVFKTDFNGNVIWAKLYYSNIIGGDQRAYNANFDYDGNILISGFIRVNNNTSYPAILKINRLDGTLIWARYWDTPPGNTNSNKAKGVISIGPGKFYLMTFIGSGTDASGGLAIIKEDTSSNSTEDCTKMISFTVTDTTFTVLSETLYVVNPNITIQDLTFNPYEPTINMNNSCEITPINNPESYADCGIKIYSRRGYLDILSNEEKFIRIYDIKGSLVYSRKVKGIEKVYLKGGVYIIRINNKFTKILVRG